MIFIPVALGYPGLVGNYLTGEKYGLLSSNRVFDFCGYLVHKIPKFRDAEVIIRCLDTPQQADGHSYGVFIIICCWAMSVYGTTDVLLKKKVTSQIFVIKLHLTFNYTN